jgi:hypothetical protein
MPNVIVTVGHLFGKGQTGITFRNSKGVLSLICEEHPATTPFHGTELNTNDISKLMHFFLESMENDNEKGNVERFEECNTSGTQKDL